MFVINFDFSQEFLPKKLLLINIPILLTQFITYPLQRLQTLLIDKPSTSYITKNQFQQSQLILRQMIGIEGFPKIFHGLRYSLDYSMTQMTTKFIIFDFLAERTISGKQNVSQWVLILNCFLANTLSTVFSQSAFNYQTIASSLPVNKNNRDENVRIKLVQYTNKSKVPLIGLKYTVPVCMINTLLEIFMIKKASQIFHQNYHFSYIGESLLTALPIIMCTNFLTHFAIQRQIQLCNKHKQMGFKYGKGLLGSQIRQTSKNFLLFCFYLAYFEYKTKSQIEGLYGKRSINSRPQPYRQ